MKVVRADYMLIYTVSVLFACIMCTKYDIGIAHHTTNNNISDALLSIQAAPHSNQSTPSLPGLLRFLHWSSDALSDFHNGRLLGS